MEVSMIESLTAADLLDECRRVMMEDLLPMLPDERRYEARMIGSALARVSRQITQSRRAAASEIDAIDALLGVQATTGAVAPSNPDRVLEERLDSTRSELCHALREGRFDTRLDNPGDLLRLREIVHAKLRVTNPKLIDEAS
jgi:Domain of unknown function (DUF6285)